MVSDGEQEGQEEKKKRIKWEDLISVFVNNPPEDIGVAWLWKSFSSFRKVVGAFIPASSRRGRSFCFVFVRFEDRRNAVRAIPALNGSFCGGWELVVKIASFGWSRGVFKGRLGPQLNEEGKEARVRWLR